MIQALVFPVKKLYNVIKRKGFITQTHFNPIIDRNERDHNLTSDPFKCYHLLQIIF